MSMWLQFISAFLVVFEILTDLSSLWDGEPWTPSKTPRWILGLGKPWERSKSPKASMSFGKSRRQDMADMARKRHGELTQIIYNNKALLHVSQLFSCSIERHFSYHWYLTYSHIFSHLLVPHNSHPKLDSRQAVHRGEKEPEDLTVPKKGKGKGKGGKGRRSRYSVVAKPPPRARPTHFVAIRLFSRMRLVLCSISRFTAFVRSCSPQIPKDIYIYIYSCIFDIRFAILRVNVNGLYFITSYHFPLDEDPSKCAADAAVVHCKKSIVWALPGTCEAWERGTRENGKLLWIIQMISSMILMFLWWDTILSYITYHDMMWSNMI